tara:strand:- start:1480 stop:1776 length:297 start_codon:yes stop_codon:yes gene_type:complete
MATNNVEKQSFGEAGAAYVTGTTGVTGEFCAITSLDDATFFSALTWAELNRHRDGSVNSTGTDGLITASETIPKGVTIYGQITGFTLGAGRVLAYNAA